MVDTFCLVRKLRSFCSDDNSKISLTELEQFLFDLKCECTDLSTSKFNMLSDFNLSSVDLTYADMRYYDGEINAFRIVLDLLSHLDI